MPDQLTVPDVLHLASGVFAALVLGLLAVLAWLSRRYHHFPFRWAVGLLVALTLASAAHLLTALLSTGPTSRWSEVVQSLTAAAAATVAITAVRAARRNDALTRETMARADELDRAWQFAADSEQRYAALAECIPQLLWVARADGGLLDANRRWAEYTGAEWEDSLGLTWKDIVHPADLSELLAAWETAARAGAAFSAEARLRRADGVYRGHINRAIPVRDPQTGATRWYGTSTDVDDQKQATTALREREQLLRTVLSHIPAGVFWKDRRSVYLGCNDQFARTCRLASAEEVVGKTDRDLCATAADAESYQARDWHVIKTGTPQLGIEIEHTWADGTKACLLTSRVPLRDVTGTVVGVLGIYQDVTDRKILEDQLRQATKMEAVGRLAGGVAHDFNNLLTIIRGNTDLLRNHRSGTPAPAELLDDVRLAAERAAGLVRQLLMFSRRETTRPEVVDLNVVVTEMAGMLDRLLGERVAVETNLASQPVTVLADRGHLDQVLLNLAVNARDAMPDGGRLTISTTAVSGETARLTVSDTGTGMSTEVRARLFEPFFTTKGPDKGTGLGLATVYGIVKQAGGRIDVDSAPGAGTTFRIDLPWCGTNPSPSSVTSLRDSTLRQLVGGGRAVLLVEDEEGVRKFARFALEGQGYGVTEAGDGESALDLLTPDHPLNLLVTDLTMPGMDGRELAERIRTLRPEVGVVFVSGYLPEDGYLDGVPGAIFLPKPYTSAALVRAAEKALRQMASDRSAAAKVPAVTV